ncbi:MAG: hypothetical protein ACLQED_06440 [Desulfobaccales bacterium]|jgi:hypothetical protein
MPRTALVLLLIVLASAGCALVPPQKIPVDRINYLDAVSTSWKEQLLTNLVSLRYGDTLNSLEMNSINTTYALDAGLTANYPILWHLIHSTNPAGSWTGGFRNALTVGGTGTYQDHPTISYSPIRGEALAKTMIEPLDPYKILTSLQTNWDVAYIYSCCVKSINHLRNRSITGKHGDPEFFRLAHDIRDLKGSGVIQIIVDSAAPEKAEPQNTANWLQKTTNSTITIKVVTDKEKTPEEKPKKNHGFIVVVKERADTPELKSELKEFIEFLGLDGNLQQYKVIDGNQKLVALSPNSDQIVLQTRSILEILNVLSMFIEVPPQHLKENRAKASFMINTTEEGFITEPLNGPNALKPIMFTIHSSKERPRDTFVAVENRGYWFYIEDTDLVSKEVFSAITAILSMAETGTAQGAPILTLPVQ